MPTRGGIDFESFILAREGPCASSSFALFVLSLSRNLAYASFLSSCPLHSRLCTALAGTRRLADRLERKSERVGNMCEERHSEDWATLERNAVSTEWEARELQSDDYAEMRGGWLQREGEGEGRESERELCYRCERLAQEGLQTRERKGSSTTSRPTA